MIEPGIEISVKYNTEYIIIDVNNVKNMSEYNRTVYFIQFIIEFYKKYKIKKIDEKYNEYFLKINNFSKKYDEINKVNKEELDIDREELDLDDLDLDDLDDLDLDDLDLDDLDLDKEKIIGKEILS